MRNCPWFRNATSSGIAYATTTTSVAVAAFVLVLAVSATRGLAATCQTCTNDALGNPCSTGFCDRNDRCCATNNGVCTGINTCCSSGSLDQQGFCICET